MPLEKVQGVKEGSCQPTNAPGYGIKVGRSQPMPLHQPWPAEGADIHTNKLVASNKPFMLLVT